MEEIPPPPDNNPHAAKVMEAVSILVVGAHKRGRDDLRRCLKDAFSIAETRNAVFTQAQVLEIMDIAGRDFDAHADRFLAGHGPKG